MADVATTVLIVFTIAIQVGAAFFAYRALRLGGPAWFWFAIIAALVVMTARRLTALAIELQYVSALAGPIAFFDRAILPLIISILLLAGLYGLLKKLELVTGKRAF